jgi:fatty-acyl-CoA synthase
MSLGSILKKRALISRDKAALIFEGREITYGELNRRVNRVAHGLASLGVQKGDRVAILSRNSSEYAEALFGTLKLGAIFVPLNFRLTVEETLYQIADCAPRVFIFENEFASQAGAARQKWSPEELALITTEAPLGKDHLSYEDFLRGQGEDEMEVELDLEDPFMIMYTSGTTGHPKGVVSTYKKSYFHTLNLILSGDLGSSDVSLAALPLFHTYGMHAVLIPGLCMGSTIVILKNFDARKILENIERYRVTHFSGVPLMLEEILKVSDFPSFDLTSIKFFLTAAQSIPRWVLEEYSRRGFTVLQGFGITEFPAIYYLGKGDCLRKMGSVGLSHLIGDFKMVDEHFQETKPGEVGEIVCRGPQAMKEYWRKPEETRKVFRDGWYLTGDLARRDEEGYVYIVDRKKDMYISGGENVYPAEVERVLTGHPAIAEATVIGVKDEKWGEVGKAFVVRAKDGAIGEGEVLEFCRGKLASYKIPRQVIFLPELPKTASGKVKKFELRGK